ncbi:MAG TPA: NAD(P)-dependent oxidoreductase [Prolixibacteraceae bacterium]|nr:NAD(P)-dependent oxidoreductase [Prolixibacteraceae bacterium]
METSTILVAGATGLLGNEICRLLRAKNLPVKAIVRTTSDPVKTGELAKIGVQLVHGDIRDKETLSKALQGIKTVISSVSSMPFSYQPGENDIQSVDEKGVINLIEASISAGINHFIYTSFSKNLDMDFPLRNAKRKVEKHLQNSGLTYTILRPGCFMELWLTAAVGFDATNGKVNTCGTGANPLAYISFKDVAKFAVESISNPAAKNAVLELGGPQNLSQLDAVKIFEEVLDKKIEVGQMPVDALQSQLDGAEDPMQKSFSGLMLCVANGDRIEMKDLLKVFPVKLTSVKEYIHSVVAAS